MRSFEELVAEAEAADVSGWGFGWLAGRATEERPPWGYAARQAQRLASASSALDLDTGGGEVLDETPTLPPRMVATEAWPPNLARARARLGPRGVEVVDTSAAQGIPLPDRSFELVTSRHPIAHDWPEIHRVLVDGGTYLAQHVGPGSAAELIAHFVAPEVWDRPSGRDPGVESAAAEAAGLTVVALRTARCRMEFHDIGAVVWILRKCVWWVPDFSVERYRSVLLELDAQLRAGQPVVAHSTRHLIEARR
ncbi:class I SAM-dependent methyltransferase [Ornithinimicrobium ciconiae]|uniref:Class I SAM-dependent methyltransferase n=1 Tax=Ornithinimicrobium ciconiae TaxID=2594265 RepID=A0A516G7H0_9MICO|nr:class I SAM-dependent methyltransferase [Ornithinimicrobium ciconiae]QDO87473.1 class I SAM-dependent methyltransferase [Ornithinimicrobium ciconiae]